MHKPHGQVKLIVDDDGEVTDYYGYSNWGNRTEHVNYKQPSILPAYLDSDLMPVLSFPQFKNASGGAQDMTPMIGMLDIAKESGGGGEGPGGNPDGSRDGNSTFFEDFLTPIVPITDDPADVYLNPAVPSMAE